MTSVYILWVILGSISLSRSIGEKCEVNRADICQSYYNMTVMPNLMLHRSQDDAIIDLGQYRKLIATECSPYLRLFLCAYFIPVCTVSYLKLFNTRLKFTEEAFDFLLH